MAHRAGLRRPPAGRQSGVDRTDAKGAATDVDDPDRKSRCRRNIFENAAVVS
jgi:hypothetical protein